MKFDCLIRLVEHPQIALITEQNVSLQTRRIKFLHSSMFVRHPFWNCKCNVFKCTYAWRLRSVEKDQESNLKYTEYSFETCCQWAQPYYLHLLYRSTFILYLHEWEVWIFQSADGWTFIWPKRGGSNKPEKTSDNQSENQHHILEVNIHCPNWGSNPHLTLAKSSLGQTQKM